MSKWLETFDDLSNLVV